jgi:hypothetical protein
MSQNQRKECHINEGPGYIYCVSSRNKVGNVTEPEKRVSHQSFIVYLVETR